MLRLNVTQILKRARSIKLLNTIILVIGIILASLAIYSEWGALQTFIEKTSFAFLMLATSMAIVTTYLRCFTHVAFLQPYNPKNRTKEIVFGYLMSQIGKYLPGKIFGLVSQSIHLEDKALSKSVVAATINQFFTTNLCAVIVALAIILNTKNEFRFLSTAILALGLFLYFLSFPIARKIFKLLPPYGLRSQLLIGFWILLEWVFFILAIYFCLPGGHHLLDAAYLGAIYSIASIAGSLAIIVPSGLFVREAIFVLLIEGTGFTTGDLIGIAIILRVIFTVADLGAYCLYIPFRWSGDTRAVQKT